MSQFHIKWIGNKRPQINIQCFPLYSVLMALGRSHVDLLSLDVEGAELGILKTIPFSRVTIDVLLIEYAVVGSKKSTRIRFLEIYEFLVNRDYYEFVGTNAELDMLFVRKDKYDSTMLSRLRITLMKKFKEFHL